MSKLLYESHHLLCYFHSSTFLIVTSYTKIWKSSRRNTKGRHGNKFSSFELPTPAKRTRRKEPSNQSMFQRKESEKNDKAEPSVPKSERKRERRNRKNVERFSNNLSA
ncbi:hypothetical protein NPIL_407931 [Nephila pilipes]|uniref:Uncharacterized protein n=1 Tax=Nephila pilipes TaxID=299642 RepID=A0A8X6QWL6_NEPPI|nr:hypothetical protein NPIL_407931 [Nephila pilipes]